MTDLQDVPHGLMAREAYETAAQHGFHSKYTPNEVYQALVISEIYEAMDADRKGRMAPKVDKDMSVFTDEDFRDWYKSYVSGTLQDELADIVIRLYDYAENIGVSLGANINRHNYGVSHVIDRESFPEFALELTRYIVNSIGYEPQVMIQFVVNTVYLYASRHGFDLYVYVLLKMRYNRLRPYRHNAKY